MLGSKCHYVIIGKRVDPNDPHSEMQRLKLNKVFAFDRHFQEQGFEVLGAV